MDKAHYIIFHPDHSRQVATVQATAMVGMRVLTNWKGDVYVDKIGIGNEDPFVFNDPWLYSYCHASQLRRNFRTGPFLQVGSKILFVSGQQADSGLLTVDTLFLVGEIQKWSNRPVLQLPTHYQTHYQNNSSSLWRRHFRFPFYGTHTTVSHTYEAELWQKGKTDFSFLPLDENGQKVSIPFSNFSRELFSKISGNVRGKYPVLLSEIEMQIVSSQIENLSQTKILRDIRTNIAAVSKQGKC